MTIRPTDGDEMATLKPTRCAIPKRKYCYELVNQNIGRIFIFENCLFCFGSRDKKTKLFYFLKQKNNLRHSYNDLNKTFIFSSSLEFPVVSCFLYFRIHFAFFLLSLSFFLFFRFRFVVIFTSSYSCISLACSRFLMSKLFLK